MKLLYATSNYSKIHNMKRRLEGLPIEIITPDELGISVDVVEDGKSAKENAIKKAKAFYEKAKMPTIAADVSLYIENVPENKQPGLFVRRVDGKVLTDEEMLKHYINLIHEAGDETIGYYIKGLAIITEDNIYSTEIKEEEFIFTSKQAKKIHKGYPLDSISIDKRTNKYFVDMDDTEVKQNENNFDRECVKFIKEHLLK